MATRDLSYLINFDVEGSEELATAAGNMETLAEATNGVSETAPSLELDLPAPSEIEDVGTAIGDLGGDGGPIDTASEKVGGLGGAFGQLVGAISLVEVASFGADFVLGKFAEKQERIAATDAFNAAQVDAFAEAIRSAGDDVTNLVDALEGGQRVVGAGFLGAETDITGDLAAANITAQEFFATLASGEDGYQNLVARVEESGVAQGNANRILSVGSEMFQNLDAAQLEAAASNEVFAETQASANQALQDLLNEQDPMRQFTSEWDLLKESMADGSIDTTAAANALNTLSDGLNLTTDEVLALAQADLDEAAQGALAFADALNSIEFDATELQGATTAFSAYTDQLFAAGNEAERREAAFDALSASAEEQALTFNIATESGRAQQDALEGVARVIDEDLAQAYDEANGSQAAFVASATRLGDETLARLQTELGLTDAQVETLRNTLGLTAADYEARFALAGAEEARLQLGLLSGAIEGLPDDLEVTVTQQILAGDFVAARDTVANYYAENPVPLPTEADTSGADADIQSKVIGAAVEKVAIISTSADTAGADQELDLVSLEVRTATIGAEADTAAADAALDTLASQQRTASIDVATGNVNLPSSFELAGRIGTVRIPIVAYWTNRIEGSRPR